MTGNGPGVNIDGNNFKMTITSPLIHGNRCSYPVCGVTTIKADGEKTKTIDYGNGECDNKTSVTADDRITDIEV